jgi:hypothetical protein
MPIPGTYKLYKSENFEEYMKAVGVGLVMRKMASTASPVSEITQNGDEWKIKTSTTFKTTEIKFQLGKEFDEETADGRQCKSTITLDGDNKMIHKQTCNGETFPIIREFTGTGTDQEMKMTLEGPGGVKSTRFYKR